MAEFSSVVGVADGGDEVGRRPAPAGNLADLKYPVYVLSEATIQKAGKALAEEAHGSARVILFGSHARGEADDRSDLDFLVVEPEVDDRFAEAARLMGVVGRLGVPADVVVVSEDHAREWGVVPGSMVHEALTQGRVVASAS